jgi:hypothetical protein
MTMTDDEAKRTVEEKLRKQQLTKPVTDTETTAFCRAMVRQLEMTFRSALSEVRAWTANWQSKWFRSN